jgi:DNA polymerase (family X)
MSNSDVAKLFRNVAAALTIKNEAKYRFQIIAYQKAADVIENSVTDLKYLVQDKNLDSLPGIGTSIKNHLTELFKTGAVTHFDTVLKEIPPAVFPLLQIPGFGPKKSYKLVTHFKLNKAETVIDDLKKLALAGKIALLSGFGEKSEKDILRAITEYKHGQTKSIRMTLPYASELADKLIKYLKLSKDVLQAYPLGSLRRRKDTVGDIDIAVSTNNPKNAITHFIAYPYQERVLEHGDNSAGLIVSGGKHIDLMTSKPESFGSLLQHFTGSKSHNIHLRELALKKGLSLSEYGIKKQMENGKWKMENFKSEISFYNYLGLQWIPPQLREDNGEIELAQEHKLPKLVGLSDIKGDLHLHSNFPIETSHDLGIDSMENMVKKAISLNYSYIGFAEHNPSQSKHTSIQSLKLIQARNKKIDQLKLKYINSIRILSLLEVDILPNGSLAIDNQSIDCLDFMLVSIHSVFSMNKDEMTKRVIKGLTHPKAKILTHPTGRLINKRVGYELNWNDLFSFCKKNNKILEINAYPERLDLPDLLVRQAIDSGVMMVIDTDSHSLAQMDLMPYGVSVAKRGWATKHNILNSKEYNEIEKWLKS